MSDTGGWHGTAHPNRAPAPAELLMVGLPGTEPTQHILDLIAAGLAGVILFARNTRSPAQVRELTAALQRHAARSGWPPLIIAIDHEGGRVQRLRRGMTRLPAAMAVGATADPDLASQLARAAGRELRALGINLNFAPCADVNTDPRNPVIGTRAYGQNPGAVAKMVAATVRGYQDEGVIATAKHFPGHGDTHLDSHLTLPMLRRTPEDLAALDLPPFAAACAAGVGAVMSAHIVIPWLTGELPATLSRPALTGLLRQGLGFSGLIMTDCMEMRAIIDGWSPAQATIAAVDAGADLVLWSHTPARQLAAAAALAGRFASLSLGPGDQALVDAARRTRALRETLDAQGRPPASPARWFAREAAAAVHAKSIVLIPPTAPELLPLSPGRRVSVIDAVAPPLDPAAIGVPGHPASVRLAAASPARTLAKALRTLDVAARAASLARVAHVPDDPGPERALVCLTRSACLDAELSRSVDQLARRFGRRLILVATGLPYDLGSPGAAAAGARLATFDDGRGAMMALTEVLTGRRPAAGTLPVDLADPD